MDHTIKLRMLASGSSGNSIFVRTGSTRVLIDAGISLRRIERAIADMDETLGELDAVLVTHEHTDHIKGLAQLFKNYPQTPVFASRGTMKGASKKFDSPANWTPICAGTPFRIGQLTVEPFTLLHDASEPTGFRLDGEGFSMGIATDLGFWTDEIAEILADCRVLVVEANYDPEMLKNGPYPAFLKRRIAGSEGHLSNHQARALVSRTASPALDWLILAHLSEKNNDPALAVEQVGCSALDDAGATLLAAGPKAGQVIEMSPCAQPRRRQPQQGLLL